MSLSTNATTLTPTIDIRGLIAGTAAGVVSTAIFHPLELLKIRWQVYEAATLTNLLKPKINQEIKILSAPEYRPKYKSLLHTASSVYKSENGLRGIYRGIGINTLASGSAWGLYFLIYNSLKLRHQKINDSTNKQTLTVANYTLDATIAGVTTILITNPLFLIKTRMCLQYNNISMKNESSSKTLTYKNSWHAFKSLLKSDGFLGLYKGIVPGLFGTLNGTIQMVTYDLMKSGWLNHLKTKHAQSGEKGASPELDTFHYSTFSSASKILAVVFTYPFQLVRARLQDQHQNYKNVFDVIGKTYKNEKFYGFYKGLIPCLLRVTPAASVTFIVYEHLLSFLKKY